MNISLLALCLLVPSVGPPGTILGPDGERLPSPIVARMPTGWPGMREGYRLDLSPSRRLVFLGDFTKRRCQIWNLETRERLLLLENHDLQSAQFSPDDRYFAMGKEGKREFFDLRTGQKLDRPPTTAIPEPPGADWYLSQPNRDTLRVLKRGDKSVVYEIKDSPQPGVNRFRSGRPDQLEGALSRDGRWLATHRFPSTVVTLHCLRTRRSIGSLGDPTPLRKTNDPDYRLFFSGDGRTVVIASYLRNAFLDLLLQIDLIETISGKTRSRVLVRNIHPPRLEWLPDGRTWLGISRLSEMTLWDFTPRVESATHETLPTHWNDLASPDAARAFRAMHALALAPDLSGPYVERQLAPTRTEPRVESWIDELGADTFAERKRASEQLIAAGESSRKALEAAYYHDDLEIRARARTVLKSVDLAQPQTLRTLRAIELLEMLRRPAALRRLSTGLPHSRITEHATAALERLKARPARPE